MPTYAKMCLRFLLVGLVVAFSGILGIARARGATPEAWAAHENEVVTACVAASKLRDPKPGGSAVDFDDRVGVTALVIDGDYPALRRLVAFTFRALDDSSEIAKLAGAEQQDDWLNGRSLLTGARAAEIWLGRHPDATMDAKISPFRPYRLRWLSGDVSLLFGP